MTRAPAIVLAALVALGASPAHGASAPEAAIGVADLGWLAGTWRGSTPAGRTIETTYTPPEGGVVLGTSKEFNADGRCVFFDLEHFALKDGALTLTPHPAGKRSPDSFPLVAFDRTARRATFANRAHDWPQQFDYARESPNRLVIVLSGPNKAGGTRTERYELRLVR